MGRDLDSLIKDILEEEIKNNVNISLRGNMSKYGFNPVTERFRFFLKFSRLTDRLDGIDYFRLS